MEIKAAKVTYIPVDHIEPNPHNPRRLFDEEPMKILKESIRELGILVPLDVYPKFEEKTDNEEDIFVLLDGERRWRCSKELDLENVPCIIVDSPSEERNILTMFHIHNVREGWQLMPTALKLKDLMGFLKTENERELAELTKLSVSQIRRCKILLTYPEKFQIMMLAPPEERFKADFFIDLHRIRGPALEKEFPPWIGRGDEKCIDIMIAKYSDDVIKAVTEFRQLVSIYRACERTNQINTFMGEFDSFLDNHGMKISDIDIPGATFAREMGEIGRSTKRLYSQLESIDLENLSANEELIKNLRDLSTLIESKLEQALLNVSKDIKE